MLGYAPPSVSSCVLSGMLQIAVTSTTANRGSRAKISPTAVLMGIQILPGSDKSEWRKCIVRRVSILTRAQSRSTASRTSSWCPIRDTPSSSRSWWEIFSSCSPLIFSRSKLWMYCWRLSSSPRKKKREGIKINYLHQTTNSSIQLHDNVCMPLRPNSQNTGMIVVVKLNMSDKGTCGRVTSLHIDTHAPSNENRFPVQQFQLSRCVTQIDWREITVKP